MISDSTMLAMSLAGLLVLVVLVYVVARNKQRQRFERQKKGLKWLSALRELLAHVQQHRGLSNGYLNGGENLGSDIERLQQAISRDLAYATSIDPSLEDNSRWTGITQHWARLAGNFKRLESDNNLSQHNNLIKSVLYLIDDLAQECDLLLLKNRDNVPLHLYWRELLSTAEYIGQARAVGTGVSAASYCDSVSRIRLHYLCEQIERNSERLYKQIGSSQDQTKRIAELISCIKTQLVVDKPTIEAGAYFSLATDTLDSMLAQFDALVKDLQWG